MFSAKFTHAPVTRTGDGGSLGVNRVLFFLPGRDYSAEFLSQVV